MTREERCGACMGAAEMRNEGPPCGAKGCAVAEAMAKPRVKLSGTDGNVFSIIGKVSRALRQAGQADRAKAFCGAAMACGSYDAVLRLCMDYTEVE